MTNHNSNPDNKLNSKPVSDRATGADLEPILLRKRLNGLFYNFPVQLLILHVKKSYILLFSWIILFGLVASQIGLGTGLPFLFLDPEYQGTVSFWSFFWIGIAFGNFFMTWNIASYMLHSYRFPFLASLPSPFLHFSINNSILPLLFILVYLWNVSAFQEANEFKEVESIFFYLEGFVAGAILLTLLFALYFQLTNKNVSGFLNKEEHDLHKRLKQNPILSEDKVMGDNMPGTWRVDYYITTHLVIRSVNNLKRLSSKASEAMFYQNHLNALAFQVIVFIGFFIIGQLIDLPSFQIPAAASTLLFLSIFVAFAEAISYWMMGWRTIGLIAIVLILNGLSQIDFLSYRTKAYGLDYSSNPLPYTHEELNRFSSKEIIQSDIENGIEILNRWKTKAAKIQGKEKPDMVLFNFSGGGLRASVWAMRCLQHLDSLHNGNILDHTAMLTGASGGVMGAAYYQSLFAQKKRGVELELTDPTFFNNMAKDVLNALAFNIVANDLYYQPFQYFDYSGQQYRRDRAYAFERIYNENTDSVFANLKVMDFEKAEAQADIPLLIITPTIINDNRKLFISTQPVGYLTRPYSNYGFDHDALEVDGIDFNQFFKSKGAENLLLSSAIRMNATYPYVLPKVFLPTEPPIQAMDAGFRDNYGFETTARYIFAFKQWLLEEVDQVIWVHVRAHQKKEPIDFQPETLFRKIFKPISVFMTGEVQDNYSDYTAAYLDELLNGKVELINLEYVPSKKDAKATMGFHLTSREKQDISNAVYRKSNQNNLENLKQFLQD